MKGSGGWEIECRQAEISECSFLGLVGTARGWAAADSGQSDQNTLGRFGLTELAGKPPFWDKCLADRNTARGAKAIQSSLLSSQLSFPSSPRSGSTRLTGLSLRPPTICNDIRISAFILFGWFRCHWVPSLPLFSPSIFFWYALPPQSRDHRLTFQSRRLGHF